MADEKELSPEEQAKKDREEALKEADNPPQPFPDQEQLNKIQSGEPLDDDGDDDGDDAAAKRKKAEAKAEAVKAEEAKKAEQQRALEANKPAGGYQTR